jgi:hypothetical protein
MSTLDQKESPERANARGVQNPDRSKRIDAASHSADKAAAIRTPKPNGCSISVSELASRLGRLARGKPKKYSAEELRRRTERLIKAAKAYHRKKKTRR